MVEGRWVGNSSPYLAAGGDTWAEEAAAAGAVGSQRIVYAGGTVPPEGVRAALRLAPNEPAVLRRRLILLNGRPVEIADSYWPADVAVDTPLENPGRIRGGAVAALAERGWTPSDVREAVTARPPTAEECRLLESPPEEWVLVLTRLIVNSSGRPYEVAVMTSPATTRQLNYSMKVD
ncbi:UTRA domain-containing protein [Streptomyces sp. NRRL F-2664]|uniref:UTRA domain-containing protein n=1 Tax=Streptomyces sp. NRRL F-2664 TaxID=1463842 RepID=UPI0004C618D3|nr:UTRA domain-containing protein [Streptomyces sp. NRRL F-2664]